MKTQRVYIGSLVNGDKKEHNDEDMLKSKPYSNWFRDPDEDDDFDYNDWDDDDDVPLDWEG